MSYFVLTKENVKALYRRAVAHVHAWNPDKAKTDFEVRLKHC